jgi:probable dihydroxyacetone kinase regulator
VTLLTKKELARSLRKLMETKPLSKITIKEIVTDCGVNRQTFYYHFEDMTSLLRWMFQTEILSNVSEYKTYATWQEGFLRVFYYVRDNRAFFNNTLYSLGREYLDDFLYNVTFSLLHGVVNEVSQGINVLDEDKKFIANFYTYAFVSLVIAWMRNGMKEDPQYIIERLSKLLEGDLEKALKKYQQA